MNELLNEYKDSFEHNGETLDVTVQCFKEPINKSDNIKVHTKISIRKGSILYAERFLPSPVKPEDAKDLFDDVKVKIDKLKD